MTNKQHLLCTLFLAGSAALAQAGDSKSLLESPSKENQAITFPFSYTGEVLGNLSGGYKQGAVYDGVLNIGIQGDLDKLAGWKGACFLISGLYPHGASLTDQYVHDFNVVSNIDAHDSSRLYEAWVQQDFADGKVSLRLGQLLADSEFFISSNGALFINSAFGAIPLLGQNCSAPVYPVAVPGARVFWNITDHLSIQSGFYDGETAETANRDGVDWHLGGEGLLAITELAYTYDPGKGRLGGVYKLGAFYHTASENEVFPEFGRCSTGGAYFIADQTLWREAGTDDQGLSGFFRIGTAPSDRSLVPFYFDTGVNYKGLIPGRDGDIAGLGFSYTRVNHDLRDEDGNGYDRHHEAILEATYKVQVNDWLMFQPDVQYIFNPGAVEKADNALVAGIRFNVSF